MIRIRRFLRPSPTLLIVAKPRFFKRPARCLDCLAAMSIFHCRDINFFIAAISIFHRRDIDFSSPQYRFFHCRDIDFSSPRYRFFFVAISIFSPHHGNIHSALQPRPITAPQCLLGTQICLSGAPFAFMAPHLPYGAPHASRRPTCLTVPQCLLGAQICLSGAPSAFMATHLP